jgi:L-methionine (R)-S-oxide reductase
MDAKRVFKTELYKQCLEEIASKVSGKTLTERMDVVCSVLKARIPYYFWVGFYFAKIEYLESGPSRGPPACSRIPYTGVCGKTARTGKPIIVPDVDKFSGHIACDPRSKSEIALPVFGADGKVAAVFDVDSNQLGSFDKTDEKWLQKMLKQAFTENKP